MSSTATATAPVKVSETPKVSVPTWATLKRDMRTAESSGVKARGKAYDTIARAFSLTDASSTDSKGTVVARSDRERGREVIDALKIEAGNVFALTDVRIGQVVKVYAAIARSGADPFTEAGKALYAGFETIRRNDLESLNRAADSVKGAKAEAKVKALTDAVEASKEAKRNKQAANKGKTTTTTVKSLEQVKALAEAMLPTVRKMSATATEADKAATRKALEALIAHLK